MLPDPSATKPGVQSSTPPSNGSGTYVIRPSRPLEGSSHTRMWPNAAAPTPATLPSPPSPHLRPHGELPAMSPGEEKTPDVRTPPPSGQLQSHSPSLDTPAGQGDRNPRSGQNLEPRTWLLTLPGRRNGLMCNCLPVLGLWPLVCWMVRYSEGK